MIESESWLDGTGQSRRRRLQLAGFGEFSVPPTYFIGGFHLFLRSQANRPGTTRAKQTAFSYTSTASSFLLVAGPINLSATFLSPIEVRRNSETQPSGLHQPPPHLQTEDLVKQSFPFSYLQINVTSNDRKAHSVQIYTDISAEWTSGDNSRRVDWVTDTTGPVLTHSVKLSEQEMFSEVEDHSQCESCTPCHTSRSDF